MHAGAHLLSRISSAAIALIAALSLCGPALAALPPHGSVTQPGVPGRGCLSDVPSLVLTCEQAPNTAVSGVAVSKDGKSVYTVDARTGGGLDQFARNASTGALTLVGCDRVLADAQCTTTVPAIGGASGVAISPDGRSVYVAAARNGAVLLFMRDASTSTVARGACYGGTTCIQADGLVGASAVAVSPDGKFVFVIGASDPPAGGTLAVFARNTRTGALTQQGCFGEQSEHCSPAVGLDGPSGVTVSPDGKNVYVAGAGGSVAIFAKSRTGAYVQAAGTNGCISSNDTPLCRAAGPGLAGATGVAVSHDGKSLYVVGSTSSTVVAFARSTTTGALTRAGCVADHAFADCTDGFSLSGPTAVAVSADGKSVYVAAGTAGSIDNFQRNTTTGALSERNCAAASFPCPEEALAVGGAAAVTVSPDGKSVYAGSVGNDTNVGGIAVFARTTAASGLGTLNELDRPPVGCLSADAYFGDECRNADELGGLPFSPVVSNDGKFVYTLGDADGLGDIAVLQRNTSTGVLTAKSCLGAEICEQSFPLTELSAMAITPDGKFAYVGGNFELATLARNPSTGALTFLSCIANPSVGAPGPPCTPSEQLGEVSGLAISKDGKSLIVGSNTFFDGIENQGLPLVVFNRSSKTGALSFAECFADPDIAPNCLTVPDLTSPNTVAMSPDGKSVYAGGGTGLFSFKRNTTTGRLTYETCSNPSTDPSGLGPCSEDGTLPSEIFNLAVAPDGKAILIAGGNSSANDGGQTTQEIRNTSTGALAPTTQRFAGTDVVISADGKHVFTIIPWSDASSIGHTTVESFTRSTAAATYGVLAPVPGPGGCVQAPQVPMASGALIGCTGVTAAAGFSTASDLALSPNGKSLYVTTGEAGVATGEALDTFNVAP